MSDQGDKDRAAAAEGVMKAASTAGEPDFVAAFMTVAQYAPDGSTLGRDVNRATALGIIEALRTLPLRPPQYAVSTVPLASSHPGEIIYVTNGAAGLPIVAFSDGASWLRVDTRGAISAV